MTPTLLPRVLIVDDERTLVASLRMLLQRTLEVTVTTDPVEAIRLLHESGPFDCVISDQIMQPILGVAVLKQARSLYPLAGLILLTGWSDRNVVIDAVNEAGVDRFMQKPFVNDEMRSTVAEVAAVSFRARQEADGQKLIAQIDALERETLDAPMATSAPATVAPTIARRGCVYLVGQNTSDRGFVRTEMGNLCDVVLVDTLKDAIDMAKSTQSIPEVMVIDVDAASDDERNDLAALKRALPTVLQIVLCSPEHANNLIHITNYARPFRLVPTPASRRMLLRFISSALEFSAELRKSPDLMESMRPAVSAVKHLSPTVSRLRDLVTSLKGRFWFFTPRRR